MNFEPDGKAKIRIILNHYRLLGLKDTLKETALYLLSRVGEDDFDRRYGVSTEGIIEPTDAGIQDEMARNLAIKYAPTREAVMRHILQCALTGQDAKEYTYIDLGCGKGRTLIMAAQFSFSSRCWSGVITHFSRSRRKQYCSVQGRPQFHSLYRHQSPMQQCR